MTEQQPLVSIVIPCYNHSQFVQETIQSVIDQDYENIELIIIDDGSKDNSVEVIQEMIPACEERFVRFEFRCRPNKGLSATLNEALKWCEGEYFSPIASDDVLMPHKISLLINNFNEEVGVVFGDAEIIDSNSKVTPLKIYTPFELYNVESSSFLLLYTAARFNYKNKEKFGSYETILRGNYLPAMSCLIKTDLLIAEGGWDTDFSIEDFQMWLSLSKKTGFYLVDECVAKYRIHGDNSIFTMSDKLRYESYLLIKMQKDFCFERGLKRVYYKSLVDNIFSLLKFSKFGFFKEFAINSKSYLFLKFFILKILNKISKDYAKF